MDIINTLISELQTNATGSPGHQIVGSAALVKALFAHLCSQEKALRTKFILLCDKDGFIIHCENNPFQQDLSGHTLDAGALQNSGALIDIDALSGGALKAAGSPKNSGALIDSDELNGNGALRNASESNNSARKDQGKVSGVGASGDFSGKQLVFQAFDDYIIIAAAEEKSTVSAIRALQTSLTALLKIIDADESNSRYLLNCLNSVKNAISIYDSNATLLYANTSFCKDLSITNLNGAIGANINTLTKDIGIKIHSMEDNSSKLKMMDVLKNGKEIIDWEVRIESVNSKSESKLLSNDMYPVLDDSGRVVGMVELTHSRKQDIKRARKIMGLAAEYTFDSIIGSSLAIREQIRRAKEFANSPFNFLITGESGVGKELFAQSIHNYSDRKKGPFVALNCANFSEGLIESELFGYIGGAFTGASKNGQTGKFELANGGTLFLDEIGELPYHFQSKLLRVLETWTVTRIGSSQQIPVDVRLVAATNRNLDEMVAEGLFRQDLYYRLQVLNIEIPPLRERKEDLPLLSDCFLKQSDPGNHTPKVLAEDAKNALMEYDWPGNVRELRNVINRVSILSKEQIITREVLEASIYSKGRAVRRSESAAGSAGTDGGGRPAGVNDTGNAGSSSDAANAGNTDSSAAALNGTAADASASAAGSADSGSTAAGSGSAEAGSDSTAAGSGSSAAGSGSSAADLVSAATGSGSAAAGSSSGSAAAASDSTTAYFTGMAADSGSIAADPNGAAPEERLNKRRFEVGASYRNLIKEALDITHGNKKQAAELLGVSRKTFYRMLEKYMN